IRLPGTHAIHRPRLDYEGLFGSGAAYDPKAGAKYISDEAQRTLDQVAAQVQRVMSEMDKDHDTFGMIHGDFIFKNTLFSEDGAVRAVDFDDCGHGYYLYDLAVPLLFYKGLPGYADLKAALWAGYIEVRPLPTTYREHLETLIAGRYVASCRWVAGNADHPSLRGGAREIIDERAAELRAFLDTGVLA
ncbi:MAG: phosphotransferase, partial [Chloroflexota bacterium]